MPDDIRRRVVLACSVLAYLTACYLPALEFRRNADGQEVWVGGAALAIGWLGIFLGQVAWYANPLWLMAAITWCLKRRTPCIVFSAVAFLISLTTWSLFGITIPADEANVNRLILTRVREGTYAWQLSMVILLVGSLVIRQPPLQVSEIEPVKDWFTPGTTSSGQSG